MTQGKAKVNYLGRAGVVMPQTVPSWDFIYEVSLIKHPKYTLGDRVVLPDGREFHYAKSAGICYSGQGCEFTQIGLAAGTLSKDQAIGDKQVTIVTNHAIAAEDEFRGGYIGIHPVDAVNTNVQFRGIIGNLYSALNANITLYLDAALTATIYTTSTAELFQNPFATLQLGANVANPKAGVPASYVDAANKYFWVQTKGFSWSAPQLDALLGRETGACWRHDGSLDLTVDGIGSGANVNVSTQYAGYRVVGTGDLVGPLFYLQG